MWYVDTTIWAEEASVWAIPTGFPINRNFLLAFLSSGNLRNFDGTVFVGILAYVYGTNSIGIFCPRGTYVILMELLSYLGKLH